jgi:malate dehydrogenase (oxaloacetate-decarboxylating)(NADP+)
MKRWSDIRCDAAGAQFHPTKRGGGMIRREEALDYHSGERPGKIELHSTKPCLTPREMRLAYLPGAAFPSAEIRDDPTAVFRYTSRGNLVGVISNGTAVPGLGNVGPQAAKPMQEGIAVLFKRLADIDVFDLELDTTDVDQFVRAVEMLVPTFGGINLKDISAPNGLYIYDRLCETLQVPVFHENLYSTAVVTAAALLNALDLVEKRMEEIQLVLCGAGTVGIGCARLLQNLGVRAENMRVYDANGLLHTDREDLLEYQRVFARTDDARDLAQGLKGADVFIGASAAGVLSPEMIRTMNRFPIVFALATPVPEIDYEEAVGSRKDVIVATSLGQYPNAIVDLLSFPYIFRGALDVQATRITTGMLLAAARALADLAREEVVEEVERAYGRSQFSFGPEYLLPKPIDPRILVWESSAVARCAIEEGVARHPVQDAAYQDALRVRLGTGRETMRGMIMRARQESLRIVFSEGTSETILRACNILIDEGIAQPILLGRKRDVDREIERLGLDLRGVQVTDVEQSPRFDGYADEYFRRHWRRGLIPAAAADRIRQHDYFAAMMVHSGDADVMIAGFSTHYVETLRTILEVIGPAPDTQRVSSHHLVLLPNEVILLADCTVNINPTAEELAEIALQSARTCRSLGIEPRVAMLSFSNFGSVIHPAAEKMRKAAAIAHELAPDLIVDGEMQLATARDGSIRQDYFPLTNLKQDANVLIFPDLQSANLTMQSLHFIGNAALIGPLLMGTRLPAHLLAYGATVEEVVNLATVAVVEAAALYAAA